jgi:hypothetical protein
LSSINLKVDKTYPFIVEDIGLNPYIHTVEIQAGGKVEFGKIGRNGTMKITFNNENGEFYPNNTESPFYQELLPNRIIKLYDGDVVKWVGYIERLETPLSLRKPKATLHCRQYLEDWRDVYMTNPLYVDQTHKSIPEQILDDNLLLSPYAENVFVLGSSSYDEGTYTEAPSAVLDNKFDAELVIPYASVGWGKEVSVIDAYSDLIDLVTGFGFIKTTGEFFLCPYSYYITGEVDHVIDLDSTAEDASFSSQTEIKNVVLIDWNGLRPDNGVIDTFTIDVPASTRVTQTIKPKSKTNEEKKYILDGLTFSCADGTVEFTLIDYGIDSVTVEVYSPLNNLEDEEITISGNYLEEKTKVEYTKKNLYSVLKFRQSYNKKLGNQLIANDTMVQSYAGRWLAVLSNDFSYIETIKITNNDTLKLGDIVQFTSNKQFLPPNTRHIITGAKHTYSNDTVVSTYNLYGGDAIDAFIVGTSEYDGGAFYI